MTHEEEILRAAAAYGTAFVKDGQLLKNEDVLQLHVEQQSIMKRRASLWPDLEAKPAPASSVGPARTRIR